MITRSQARKETVLLLVGFALGYAACRFDVKIEKKAGK